MYKLDVRPKILSFISTVIELFHCSILVCPEHQLGYWRTAGTLLTVENEQLALTGILAYRWSLQAMEFQGQQPAFAVFQTEHSHISYIQVSNITVTQHHSHRTNKFIFGSLHIQSH